MTVTALLVLPTATSGAKPVVGAKRIVFSSERNVGVALYTMAANGHDVRPLTTPHPGGASPSFSPDGRLIAFEAMGGRSDLHGIWLMNPDGKRLRSILNWKESLVMPEAPTWAPDGKRLAFARDGQVWVTGLDGSDAVSLAGGHHPAWSPGGRSIAFSRGFDIWVMNPDGSHRRRLQRFANGTYPEAAWSPDGKRLVVAAGAPDSDNADLFLLDPDSSTVDRLTATQNENEYSPAWSPSRLIAYAGSGGTRVISPDGDRSRLVIRDGYDATWGPHGQRLVFDRDGAEGWRIFVANGRGTGVRRLLVGNDDEYPAWSPDRKTVAFIRSNVLQLLDLASGKVTSLRANTDGVSWAPDGTRLAATYSDTVMIISRDGSALGRIRLPVPPSDEAPPVVSDPAWSPDGESIIFSGERYNDAETTNIYVVRASGGVPQVLIRQLPTDDFGTLHSALWSPDGSRIAFVSGNAIYICSSRGTGRRLLFASSNTIDRIAWSPSGTSIVFDNGDSPHIASIKVSGGTPKHLTGKASENWGPDW